MNATPPTPKPKKIRALAEPLPQAVELGEGFSPRADRPVTSKKGVAKRRVVVEVADANAEAVAARLTPRMTAAGFTGTKLRAREDGSHMLRFRKPGYGDVIAVIKTSPSKSLRNPGARSLLRLDWPA